MTKANKMAISFLTGLGILIAVSVVGENDYRDQVMALHHTCELYPKLSKCVNYDDTAYVNLMNESK